MIKKHLSIFSLLVLSIALVFSCKKETSPASDDGALLSSQAANKSKPPSATQSLFASGLNNPRGLKFGPDGNLYVAEAGIGGNISSAGFACQQAPMPFGPYFGNPTGGRVSVLDKMTGARTTVTTMLPSARSSMNDILGPADVAFVGQTLYVLETGGGCSRGMPDHPSGIYKVNANQTTSLVADLSAYQHANPVAHPEEDDFEPDGSWYSMVAVRGDLYALEANHGELVKVDPNTLNSVTRVVDISATQGHIVPTAMDYRGNFYIANLDTFPILPAPGGSKIFKVNPSGNIQVVADSLSTVLGLVITQTSWMYVLEMTVGAPFPTPGTGKILAISPSGERTQLTTGLNFPTGMTMGPDGNLYVSTWGFGKPPGGGQVMKITLQ